MTLPTKILVIGSKGQLASELQFLSTNYPQLSFLFCSQQEVNISEKISIEEKVNLFQPNFIINCAAYTAVDKAESESELAYQVNEIGVRNLAEVAKENNIFLIHISTDFVFDGNHSTPYIESDAVNPLSVYGMSKLRGEEAISRSGCNYAIIRTSWLYSSFGHNFVKTMIRLGAEKPSLNVVFDQVGSPTYCRDLAQVILDNYAKFLEYKNNIYHYSNEGVASWYDFAVEIMKQNKLSCQVYPIRTSAYPTPATRPPYSLMDKAKIKSHLHIEIPHWKESLRQCIQLL